MTTDVIIPFPEDLVYNDLVENNIPPSDVPLVSPSSNSLEDSDENDVNTSDSTWTAAAGKEFRSSFLFQSSCYLPDDDGTESETSYTQHTSTTTTIDYPLGLLHRDEAYPNRQQQPPSLHESISATSISSILKLSTSNTENIQPPRRVMFYDDDNDNLNTMNSNIDLLVNRSDSGGGHREDDIDEEKSSWVGFNRIVVPLHHKFHSLPQMPSIKTTTATTATSTIADSYHSQLTQSQSQHDQLQQYGDEEDCRIVASEFQYDTKKDDARKRKRCQRISIFTILFLVFGSMTVALTCGMTQCGRDIQQELSSSNSSHSNVSSPTVTGSNSFSPTMTPSTNHPQPSEQTSPTLLTQTRITMPPSSISPTFTHETIVIASTEQLYRAVDAYILYRYNKTIVTTDEYDYYSTPIGLWDVSRITNFSSIFSMLRNPMMQQNFNEDIGLWDTSNAVTMEQMFYGAEKWVNGNISHWITSNVTNMREMFARTSNFNDDISLWDVSKVTTMEGMCKSKFGIPLLCELLKISNELTFHH
jgi:surface protein